MLEGLLTVRGLVHDMPLDFARELEHDPRVGVVLDDQDAHDGNSPSHPTIRTG
jgi:hypothetical protein